MNLHDELAARTLRCKCLANGWDVLELSPATLDAVVPVSQEQVHRVLGEKKREQTMNQLRGSCRERSELEDGTLDGSQTFGKPSGRISDREQIVRFRALVVGDARESLVEFPRKLTATRQSGRDADARPTAYGEGAIARLVHQDDDRCRNWSTQRLPNLHAASSYGLCDISTGGRLECCQPESIGIAED
jgi:hypothetical protein